MVQITTPMFTHPAVFRGGMPREDNAWMPREHRA